MCRFETNDYKGLSVARILTSSEDGSIKILSPVTGQALHTIFPAIDETVIADIHYDIRSGMFDE